MVVTFGSCFHCRLPPVSRNGKVLFLSERPLAALADELVFALVRPWRDRNNGTIVQIRLRPPWRRPVLAAEASVVAEP